MKLYFGSFLAAFIAAYSFSCATESGQIMSDSELLNIARERTSGASNSGGWSTSGKLEIGGSKSITLQCVFPKAGNYMLEFAVERAVITGGSDVQQTEAIITWSVEGNSVSRRVTIGNGVTVSGAAQGVRVEMVDASQSSAPSGREYLVSMQVTPGTRATTGQPPTLEMAAVMQVLAGGASADFTIPDDAGAISVYTSVYGQNGAAPIVLPNNSVTVTLLSETGQTLRIADPNVYEWIPIPPGAKTVRVTNNMAVGNTIYYRPTLGIDG